MNSTQHNSTSRVRDYVIYVAISLAVGAVAIGLGRSSLSLRAANEYFGLAFYSAIVYGVFISANWSSRRLPRFWLVTTAAFCLHGAVFVAIIVKIPYWRPIWNLVMFLELPVLERVRAQFAPESKARHSRSKP
jgi:hypothetical protein